jgi:hypothetical protein
MVTNTTTDGLSNFTSSAVTLVNEFAAYLQAKLEMKLKTSLHCLESLQDFLLLIKVF